MRVLGTPRRSMVPAVTRSWWARFGLAGALIWAGLGGATARAGEPHPKSYWNVDDLKPGMKGTGRTVMVGTKLEEFGAEVLGVMKGVSPGRDMVLCRLTGLNLEHAGIIQGMSGSPIYIEGKLVGAVAFAWEFAKDPIAGVTPFSQMVEYVRSTDKRVAAETGPGSGALKGARPTAALPWDTKLLMESLTSPETLAAHDPAIRMSTMAPGNVMAGMRPIATPLAASGFSARSLAFLGERLSPIGMAPMSGGAASEKIVKEEGDKPLVPGSPLSIAMVTGDFDLSGIGTVTHVEGGRVYGFGHPMMSLGSCEFPMMTGYIHTVYPRASVSMKLGSPLKVVGVVDADVSTGVAGRFGEKPDMLPMSVKVKAGRYSETKSYKVEIVREPMLLPTLVMSVLTNAIDTEGNLPEELSGKLRAVIKVKGYDPIVVEDVLSGPRFTGPMGPMAMFGPISAIVTMITRNPFERTRIESIDCSLDINSGRKTATIEALRLVSDRVEPGKALKAVVTVKPYKAPRETVEIEVPIPADFPEGSHELIVSDMAISLRRKFRNDPVMSEPRDVPGVLAGIRQQVAPKRNALYAHVALPDRGVAVQGQSLPNLPSSVRSLFSAGRQTAEPGLRADQVTSVETAWVLDGSQNLRFHVARDTGISEIQ